MKRFRALKPLAYTLTFISMTVLTEIGGLLLIGTWILLRLRIQRRFPRLLLTSFIYLFVVLLVTPVISPLFGRVRLPLYATDSNPVAPRSFLYVLTCRNYVSPEMAELVNEASLDLRKKHPHAIVHYLDANFPFIDGVPLFPHLSHSDGEKIDFAFFYRNKRTDKACPSPSPIGYWIYEAPTSGEPAPYEKQSCLLRWDFPFLQGMNRHRELDETVTRDFLQSLLAKGETHKILLEPHLHSRLKLQGKSKLRFQQCNAARHDDHLHLQRANQK